MRPLLSALAVLALAVAGCVTPANLVSDVTDDDSLTDAHARLRALLADVPCEADVTRGETSENFLEVAFLQNDGSAHGELDANGPWVLDARYQAGGFGVVSLHDSAAPKEVAAWHAEAGTTYDVKWMPDGKHAVVGFAGHVALVDVTPVTESGLPVDTLAESDAAPVLVSEWTYPEPRTLSNMHMLYTHTIDGTDYVFLAPNDDTGVWILEFVNDAGDPRLEYVTNVGEPLGGGPLGPHDMYVHDDEFLDVPVLYVANGVEGWLAWDVSDPANPELLAAVPNYVVGQGYTHSVTALDIDGRRIVATVAEVGVNTLKVYDATDFTAPVLLGEWWAETTNPVSPQHNLQFVDGYLFMGHYTHGVFVFDLTDLGSVPYADSLTLEPVAQFAPPSPVAPDALGFANVWDVLVHEGVTYVNDMENGLYVVGFGCFEPGDAALSGRG